MNDQQTTSEEPALNRQGDSGSACNDLLSAPYGEFDLDLVQLIPDIVTDFEDDRNLWAFGSRSDHHPGCFVSLTYWNGPGCVLLSNLIDVTLRDRDGWSNWRGHVTRDEILRIPLSEAVRYMWVQCYTAVIDGESWIVTNPQLHRYHQDILGHVRKYAPTQEYEAKLSFVRDWVRAKMQVGRYRVDRGRERPASPGRERKTMSTENATIAAPVHAMVHMPFDRFECDKCGACCESLIVEAHDYDARREPKLYQIGNVDRQKLRDGEHCIMLYDTATRACPFLDGETKHCGIYATRPVACVMVEAGDAKCQQARRAKGLPFLCDRDGNEPSRELLLESCEKYDLDPCELGM